jgi:ankyrin repeat protein
MHAVRNGMTGAVTLMLAHGADVNEMTALPVAHEDDMGMGFAHYVPAHRVRNITYRKLICTTVFFQREGNESALHIACVQGNVELAKVLLDAGADTEIRNHVSGNVALVKSY